MTATLNESKIIMIVDEIRTSIPEFHGLFSGWQWEGLRGRLLRAGIHPDRVIFRLFESDIRFAPSDIIIGLGEKPLQALTGKKGIDKWHLSPLHTNEGALYIPTYGVDRITKQFELALYQELAFKRACEFSIQKPKPIEERFLLNPSLEESLDVLRRIKDSEYLSVDVETGYGQINTVGFAWSPQDAIAINVLPDRCGDTAYFELWSEIKNVVEGPAKKVFQNFIYDTSYFSAYGIKVQNLYRDTMWCMKFLFPELDMNLGNVGRLFTQRPYWKDDGKIEGEEGKKKDWGNIRDWVRHYTYNCRDTTGALEACHSQTTELRGRNLLGLYDDYLIKLAGPILEMCSNGMPLCLETRERLRAETEAKIQEITKSLHEKTKTEMNPRSWQQKLKYLEESGVEVPKKFDRSSGKTRKSTDQTSLMKIKLKHPELPGLTELINVASFEKALSSYINFNIRPGQDRIRYSLNGTGTETLRFSGNKDPWDCGFNIQTIPREGGEVSIKSMFVAPEGYKFIECDLRQAESRFVAYDSADKTLIDMLEGNQDVHSHVGREILRSLGKKESDIPKEEFKKTWRQLGKKSGHGANYAMKAGVFVETCFSEMEIVLSRKEADAILEAYHRLFPGIRRWHHWIREELRLKRKLTAPSGWERYFYGRLDDSMFREAYAWRPQHTIPWITNNLMLYLTEERKKCNLNFHLLIQVHDAIYLLAKGEHAESVMRECHNLKAWHPEINLPGGKLVIPTETKWGTVVADLEEWGEK